MQLSVPRGNKQLFAHLRTLRMDGPDTGRSFPQPPRPDGVQMQRSWEQSVVLVVGTAVGLWVAGIVLFLTAVTMEATRLGLLLVIVAAVTTILGVVRTWQLRMHRAFVHGYHAGWHEQTRVDCYDGPDCDVLDFAEVQSRKLAHLS